MDGGYAGRQFSTLQVYTLGGEAKVEAFSKPEHHLTEGHVVTEDKVVTPASEAGFALTDVLSD
jgi:hypothetical protein